MKEDVTLTSSIASLTQKGELGLCCKEEETTKFKKTSTDHGMNTNLDLEI